MNHTCLIPSVRPTDYLLGDGHIAFKGVLPSADWTGYIKYFERQKFAYDSNLCVIFAAQEDIDAQIDYLIQTGQVQASVISHLTALGFMDVSPLDNQPHFHSSADFLGALTGNGMNGNPLVAPWDVARKYGILPWVDRPFNDSTTVQQLLALPTQAELDKAKAVLQYFTFPYHWVENNSVLTGTPISKMKTALQQSPLCIGINTCGDSWNQPVPLACADLSPEHSVMVYRMDTMTRVLDHYAPFEKSLPFQYNIGFCLQGIVNVVPQDPLPPPAPPLISTPPTPQQKQAVVSWLDIVKQWLQNLLNHNP